MTSTRDNEIIEWISFAKGYTTPLVAVEKDVQGHEGTEFYVTPQRAKNLSEQAWAQSASIAKSFGEIAKGDLPGHPFRGNQFESEVGPVAGVPSHPTLRQAAPAPRGPRSISHTIKADGNVNPRTGRMSMGSKTPHTFDPSRDHAIVIGQRPSGSTFTRMIPVAKPGEMLPPRGVSKAQMGDSVHFYTPSGQWKGSGVVRGITHPTQGTFEGEVPDRPLSFNKLLD